MHHPPTGRAVARVSPGGTAGPALSPRGGFNRHTNRHNVSENPEIIPPPLDALFSPHCIIKSLSAGTTPYREVDDAALAAALQVVPSQFLALIGRERGH